MNIQNTLSSKNKLYYPIFLFFSVIILYLPVFYKLFYWWESDDNYNHGVLIPIVTIYLIWKKRDIFKTIEAESSKIGIFLIALGIILNLIGARVEFLRVSVFSFIFIIFGLLLYGYGKELTQELLFPICFLLIMIPIPYIETLTLPLKIFATQASVGFIRFINIPAVREGTVIYLKNFSLEVTTACSGLKSIVLVTTIGILYAYMTQTQFLKRLSISLLSILIAILANISRIILTAFLAANFSDKIAFKFNHDFSGIFVFVIAGAMLVIAGEIADWIFQEKTSGF